MIAKPGSHVSHEGTLTVFERRKHANYRNLVPLLGARRNGPSHSASASESYKIAPPHVRLQAQEVDIIGSNEQFGRAETGFAAEIWKSWAMSASGQKRA